MPSIKEILKMNNIDLDISDAILNININGNFKFNDIHLKKYFGIDFDHELYDEKILSWDFKDFNSGKSFSITPNDLSWTLEFGFIEGMIVFNSNAQIVCKEPDFSDEYCLSKM